MKKSTELKCLLIILYGLITLSCEKNYKDLLGTWVSTDLIDTVEFRTNRDFYKTVGIPKDHFNYHLHRDSITIQYDGALYILVHPTNHYYKLNEDKLTIDFNKCYGFRQQIITFSRE